MLDPSAHGIATVGSLRAAGIRDAAVRTAIRRGRLVRIRPGVVADPACDALVLAAARIGGRVAGVTAAGFHGCWVPPRRRVVVEVPRGTHVPDTSLVVIRGPAGPRRYGVSGPDEVIGQVLRTEPAEIAVAVIDSLLRRSALTRTEVEFAVAALPRRLRRLLRLVDSRAESGTESIVRVLLALAGIAAQPQVRVPFTDLDRLDLLVGDRLVIECDSREHHSSPGQLDRDAARDLALTALGFVVLRVRYRSVVRDPAAVVAAVRRLVDAGLHLDHTAPSRRDARTAGGVSPSRDVTRATGTAGAGDSL